MQDNLVPNKSAIKEHLEFLFKDVGDYKDAVIELAYTPHDRGAVNKAEYFSVDSINEATDRASALNSQEGVNVYVGAALRQDNAPFGRSSLQDYYSCRFIWCDLDAEGAAHAARDIYKNLPPSKIIVTGRYPYVRAQAWWMLNIYEDDHSVIKDNLAHICTALNGDPAVVDPARVMRLGGTVAWPKKQGRVPELTEVITPQNATESIHIDKFKSYFPISEKQQEKVKTTASGTKNIITGTFEIEKLLERTRTDGQWHFNMRDAVAAMVGKGWTNQAVHIATRPYLRDNSLLQDMITPLINTARAKFNHPEPESVQMVDLVTGEIEKAPQATMTYTKACDIKLSLEDNYLIKDVLGTNELSVIYGESNCGKTFFMLDIALHIAREEQWFGKKTKGGAVMYAALEGSRGFQRRFHAHCMHHDVNVSILPFAYPNSALDFYNNGENIEAFIAMMKAFQDDVGQDPALIVIDTLARAIGGGDENSGQDMGLLVKYADLIRKETNAHLSFVHHSGKNKALGARGHSSLRAAVDTEIEISRDDGEEQSIIKFVKQREIEMIDPLAFGLHRVSLGFSGINEEITSCVIMPQDIINNKKEATLTPKEQFVYDAIIAAIDTYGIEKAPISGMTPVLCITYIDLAELMEQRGFDKMFDKDGEQNALKATKNIRVNLQAKNIISFNRTHIWLLK